MIILFISVIQCAKPIFFAPGMSESELYATITNTDLFPNCTGTFIHTPLIRTSNITTECRNSLLDVVYNSETGLLTHPEGVIIETDSIQKENHDLFLQDFNDTYYVYYDWTLYSPSIQTTFSILKAAIENNVTSGTEKVILMGYSMGTNFMRYFITEYVTKEWVDRYIDGVIFLAPGIGGTFTSIIFVATEQVIMITGKAALHMPSQWMMFPNFPLYKGCIEDKNGKLIDAENVYEEMQKNGYSDDTTDHIYEAIKPYLSKEIRDPGIRAAFVMNSGLQGTCGVKYVNGSFERISCPADGNIETRPAKYACENWNDVQCFDYNMNDRDYDHLGIGRQKKTAELVKMFVNGEPFPTPDGGKSWFSGITKIIIIVCVAALVLAIIVVAIVCVVKKRNMESKEINVTLINED